MNTILSGERVVKSFGDGAERRNVLDGVSVEIRQGEFVSIMGPSGSGKSTLLYALSGMDRVDGGRILFEGRDLSGLRDDDLADLRRRRMGFVFQQPTLLGNLDLLDNIILPAVLFGDEPTGALNSASAREILDILSEVNAAGTAVLLVTHDAAVAARAGRVLFLRDGRIDRELELGPSGGQSPEERTRRVSEAMRELGI